VLNTTSFLYLLTGTESVCMSNSSDIDQVGLSLCTNDS
jgi:hypothetical protein